MKKNDIVLIVVAVIVSAILSFVIGKLVFNSPKNRSQKVEVVEAISTDFTTPDSKYFNASSINPTQLIRIGENSNTAPFTGATRR